MRQINVTRSSMPDIDDYISEIRELWDTHWLTNMGTKHRQLQEELKKYLDVSNVGLFVNGHLSLELSLQALELSGEVITTPFTFASTTHAIVRNKLEPVFCDINPIDFTMDVEKIEALITDRTTAIMPVHVYGNVCDVERIEQIAKSYGLKVIYDAAHTFGVKYKGISTAAFGDISCFSFHATKVFHTIEGGAACYRDPEIGRRLSKLRNFGIRDEECVDGIGANAKMNEFCAVMGICNLRIIDEEIAKRKKVADKYREILGQIEGIQLSPIQQDVESNYAYFPIIIHEKVFGATRNDVAIALEKEGIKARKYFYPLTNTFDCFHGKFDVTQTPVALHISKRVLTLPLYADLALDDVDRICEIILGIREK